MSDRLPRGRMVALYEAQRAELNALYEHGTPVLPQGCVLEGPPSITLSDGFFYGDVGQQRVLRRAKMAVLAVSLSACEGADENSLLSRPGHARASNEVLLKSSRRSRPSRNASLHRNGSMQRSDHCRNFLLLRSRPEVP